ncbi:PhzF family phenazine biosynthesis protein [Paenibacillus xylanilyticus]|uniref:PhzF family phenazine biosynthesis protein n=1 Tax=Paenibacillus xylanilyticus TaxID=248903 RepID=UPI0039A06B25
MEIEVITLHAFSDIAEGGNPAGVVLQAEYLSAAQMQEIARQVGFSETAFVMPSDFADYKVRFFTPNHEVDLCGHATVALFYLMKAEQMVDVGIYTLDTLAGILEVTVEKSGEVYLSQTLPQFGELVNRQDIADSLQIPLQDLHPELPVQIVSTGLRDILIPVRHPDVLAAINPDLRHIADISKAHQVVGYHVFAIGAQDNAALAECRNFAPLYDIPEESATGTSNGALLCYLHKYQQLPAPHDQTFMIKQGYTMNRPSKIQGRISLCSSNEITQVQIGGVAVHIENIQIHLP